MNIDRDLIKHWATLCESEEEAYENRRNGISEAEEDDETLEFVEPKPSDLTFDDFVEYIRKFRGEDGETEELKVEFDALDDEQRLEILDIVRNPEKYKEPERDEEVETIAKFKKTPTIGKVGLGQKNHYLFAIERVNKFGEKVKTGFKKLRFNMADMDPHEIDQDETMQKVEKVHDFTDTIEAESEERLVEIMNERKAQLVSKFGLDPERFEKFGRGTAVPIPKKFARIDENAFGEVYPWTTTGEESTKEYDVEKPKGTRGPKGDFSYGTKIQEAFAQYIIFSSEAKNLKLGDIEQAVQDAIDVLSGKKELD